MLKHNFKNCCINHFFRWQWISVWFPGCSSYFKNKISEEDCSYSCKSEGI